MEMTPREAELTARVERLEKMVSALTVHLENALRENERLRAENKLLREKVDKLVRRIFGKSSEKIDPAQLELLLQVPEEETALGKSSASPCLSPGADTWEASPDPRRKPRPAPERRPRLPEHLPVVEQVIEPDEVPPGERAAWRRIGEEVSEQLDYEPARFVRRRTIRPKYVRRGDVEQPPVIAPLPPSLQDACLAAPGLIAAVIVSKYCDHLPLYRQEMIYQTRHGVALPRQTMCRWMALAAFWLRPLYEKIKTTVLDGHCVQADETPIEYLEPGHGSTRTGYFWTLHRPGGDTVFTWQASRAAACLEHCIPDDWYGILQCDGYAAYPAFVRQRQERTDAVIVLAGCMAHARRGFVEALAQAQSACAFILRQMQHLYAIERQLRETRASPALRQAVRSAQSRPLLQRLHRWCIRLSDKKRYLPQSNMGKALSYFLNQWEPLGRFLEDGRLEIDNNLAENSIRPTAVGKKNWLFIGAEAAGETSAILYTLIESARRRGIDPFEYLRDALTRLPRMKAAQISTLTPQAWAAARKTVAGMHAVKSRAA
jgi:transposase